MDKPTCTIEGCEQELRARGWCSTHWLRWRKHGDPSIGARNTPTNCVVEKCDGKPKRRGMCTKHYGRWKRHGDPLVFRPDATRGCAITDCQRDHYSKGWCVLHWTRSHKTGSPLGLLPHFSPLAGRSGALNPMWAGDDVGYGGVHIRLRKELGPASDYECMNCIDPASDWAYDHEDLDERVSPDGGLPYSTKGSRHYLPLCSRCHIQFDRDYARVHRASHLDQASP